MRGLRILAFGLACSLVAIPAMAASSSHATTPKHSTAKQIRAQQIARNKALTGFQRDLVSVLATRVDAQHLLGAALLARPLADQPVVDNFRTLITRAAQASDAGPAVTWAQLSDCDRKAETCPNAKALEHLTTQAPDNAAVWLLKLGQDVRNMRKKDALADLAHAANAKLYDDYAGISLKALANAVATLPPPAATIDPSAKAGAAGVQVMIAYGLAAAQPQPALRVVAGLCKDKSDEPGVKADCLKLGQLLQWGSSPLSRSLGLYLSATFGNDPSQQQSLHDARRDLVWQVQNFAELAIHAQDDPAEAIHLLMLARNGGTQMSLMLAALRDAGIPTEAPAGWKPKAAE
ncbi:hypothetical protein [Dyella sp. A6]|uniref:hypothetical protein n=1 Tax=Dyella aluminiiresistens TaxID=3069105 RepID=UPI002E79E7B9|nr:hypothetical protein [Dyella sp. A6]